jgi:hypothetical protein
MSISIYHSPILSQLRSPFETDSALTQTIIQINFSQYFKNNESFFANVSWVAKNGSGDWLCVNYVGNIANVGANLWYSDGPNLQWHATSAGFGVGGMSADPASNIVSFDVQYPLAFPIVTGELVISLTKTG